jgi:hypothetical protein
VAEHVFLCGLNADQFADYPDGTKLSLDERDGNVVLRLGKLRGGLRDQPKRLTDFIEIASYVFAADRKTSRGSLTDRGVGRDWRRSIGLVIAVRDLEFWLQQEVGEAMGTALGFLSEDNWSFEFVENLEPVDPQLYLSFETEAPQLHRNATVILFSGGLDSLAGAVHELESTERNVVLVSHRNIPGVGARQKSLADHLGRAYPGRLTHVWLDNNLRGGGRREETQRTRSFFFSAMASVVALIERADRIRFYENGIMSINLPIATQVVGARASRSTHPLSLILINRFVNLVSGRQITVENPFIWKTKVEIVLELANSPHASLIATSVSCTRARTVNNRFEPHCGTCIQCLQRRISTLGGGASEIDEAEAYDTDFLLGARRDGEDRTMAVGSITLALDCEAMSTNAFMRRFADEVSWVLQAHPRDEKEGAGEKMADLFRRHGGSVAQILSRALESVATDVIRSDLPPSSLLALVLASRLPKADVPTEVTQAKLPEPRPDQSDDRIYLAVDEVRQRIRISDRAELYGPTVYPIIRLLASAALEDAGCGLLPKSRRAFLGKSIANLLDLDSEDAVRAAVKRARDALAEEEMELHQTTSDPHAIIESTRRGYRIAPGVDVVTPDEFLRQTTTP